MSYRFMRIMVFFDLPSVSLSDKKSYRKFRKFLLMSGFMMLQESVYCKLALNQTVSDSVMKQLKANKPSKGSVQAICITEKQFAKMEFITGSKTSELIDTDERLIIL